MELMKQPTDAIRIDMIQGFKLPNREYIAFLLNGMRLIDVNEMEAERLIERLDRGDTPKALLSIELAERARKNGKDIFLDFGAAIADFLPKPFTPAHEEAQPAQRFVKLSDLCTSDDTQLVRRCLAVITGRDASQSTLEYYVDQLQREHLTRITLIQLLVEEARAAGTKTWFELDVGAAEFSQLCGLDSAALPVHRHSGFTTHAFRAVDELFLKGWYPVERELNIDFRWMSRLGQIRNPNSEKPLIRVEFFVSHVYGTDSPSLRCSVDETALTVVIETADGGHWIKATSADEKGLYGFGLNVESMSSGSPATDNLGSNDNRLLSIAISHGKFIFLT
jgi:hypothetical protein